MSKRDILLQELNKTVKNPQNYFEKEIAKEKKCISKLSTERLNDVYVLNKNSERLCSLIPYSKKDILTLFENDEVSPTGKIAELCNNFIILEKIFSDVNGKEF